MNNYYTYPVLTRRQAKTYLLRTQKLYDYLCGIPQERINLNVEWWSPVEGHGGPIPRSMRHAEATQDCGCIAGWVRVLFARLYDQKANACRIIGASDLMADKQRYPNLPHKEEALRRLETHMEYLKKILAMLVLFWLPLSAHAESFYPSTLDTAPFNMHDPGPSTTDGAAPVYEPLDLVRHVAPTQLDGLDLAPAPAPAPSPAPLAIEEDLANERAARQARQRLWNSIR